MGSGPRHEEDCIGEQGMADKGIMTIGCQANEVVVDGTMKTCNVIGGKRRERLELRGGGYNRYNWCNWWQSNKKKLLRDDKIDGKGPGDGKG